MFASDPSQFRYHVGDETLAGFLRIVGRGSDAFHARRLREARADSIRLSAQVLADHRVTFQARIFSVDRIAARSSSAKHGFGTKLSQPARMARITIAVP
jgi:hypothetical protein